MQRPRAAETVSRNMSRIRSSNTRLEVQFGKAMWAAGIRYRKQYPVTGKPDFALPRLKIAVFCDSHFWHGYRWTEHGRKQIRTRPDFWIPKIERNMERDREVDRALQRDGWAVLRFWEHELTNSSTKCVRRVLKVIAERRRRVA